MDQIFGSEDLGRPELFEVENGMMLSIIAEKHIEAGRIVMVPFVSDEASKEEVDAWDQSERKRYKIRVVDTKDQEIKRYTPFSKEGNPRETYNEFLEGKEVQVSSDHRPRARYLYWHYCLFMLKHSWHKDLNKGETIKKELGERYWGTRGAFMEKTMLLAFVESLLEGAVPGNGTEDMEPDPTAILVAANAIHDSVTREARDEAESAETEDEENDRGQDKENERREK